MSFDIVTNYRWDPPSCACVQCRALYVSTGFRGNDSLPLVEEPRGYKCRVCGTVIDHSEGEFLIKDLAYANDTELRENLYELGAIASQMPPARKSTGPRIPPLAILMKAIAQSRRFIHFLTYSTDTTMLGALKMASEHTQVRGIVGTLNSYNQGLLEELGPSPRHAMNHDGPFLILAPSADGALVDPVHTKIVIVDGLLAFKGSANLTVTGYQNAGANPPTEIVEVVTQPSEVLQLNNEHFSPSWFQNTPEITATDLLRF